MPNKIREIIVARRSKLSSYFISTIIISVAAAIQYLLWPLINPAPFLVFYPAITVAAILTEDGFLAVMLSAVLGQYLFVPPMFSFQMVWPNDFIRQVIFILSGFGIVVVTNALRRAQIEVLRDQEKLKAANQELAQFAFVAAHDLKAPLNSIAQFSELITTEFDTRLSTESREYFRFITAAITRMTKLIDSLLEFATAGKSIADFNDVDLDQLLKNTVENLKFQIHLAGAKVEIGTLPVIKGDHFKLLTLFQNLIANSIKYRSSERVPEIVVDASEDQNSWIISVKDNGTGFNPRFKDQVFQPFKRLHSGTAYEGAGIGLATAKKVVNAHCGDIWVDTAEGVGSTFYVKLPKAHSIEDACAEVNG